MAVCTRCDQEMTEHVSCTTTVFHRQGVAFALPTNRDRFDCGDCGAPPGGHHHPGCDLADCPVCGRQMLSCGCRFDEDGPDEDDDLDDADGWFIPPTTPSNHPPAGPPGRFGWSPVR